MVPLGLYAVKKIPVGDDHVSQRCNAVVTRVIRRAKAIQRASSYNVMVLAFTDAHNLGMASENAERSYSYREYKASEHCTIQGISEHLQYMSFFLHIGLSIPGLRSRRSPGFVPKSRVCSY